MQLQLKSLATVTALLMSSAALAQAQPAQQTTSTTTQQTPTQTQSTTTNSTTTAVPGTPAAPAQTQTTTTKSTTTTPTDAATGAPVGPSESSTTSSTTTTTAAATKVATAADVKKGVVVYDQNGGVVGKIDSVSGKNAVLSTGSTRATVPISSFAKNDKGLVIGMTKAEIDAQAKKAGPKSK
ncbi:MAG: hypothetical protein ACTHOI_13295 [Sphingomicrobium sp.]